MFLRHLLPSISWALVILLLCGIPASDMPDFSWWQMLSVDKFGHAGVFSILVASLIVGFRKQRRYKKLRSNSKKWALIVAICFGGIIELTQGMIFAGRSTELLDFVANVIGCFLGLLLFRLIYGKDMMIEPL